MRAIVYDPAQHAEQLVWVYRQIFAEKPWNEFRRCTNQKECGIISGTEEDVRTASLICPQCGVIAEYFHDADDILRRAARGKCVLFMDRDRIVGFLWGWRVLTPFELHRVLSENRFIISQERINKFVGAQRTPNAVYIDEIAVHQEYRGGFQATGAMIQLFFKELWFDRVFFWTARQTELYAALQYVAQFQPLTDEKVLGQLERETIDAVLELDSDDRRAYLTQGRPYERKRL